MSVSRPADGNAGQTLRFANGKSSIRKRRTDAAKGDAGPDGEPGAKTVTAWVRRERLQWRESVFTSTRPGMFHKRGGAWTPAGQRDPAQNLPVPLTASAV